MVGAREEDAAGWDPYHGHGLVNALESVKRAAPPAPELTVAPMTLQVPATLGNSMVTVANTGTGEMPWNASVTSGAAWLSVSNLTPNGVNPGSFRVNFAANATGTTRNAEITVTGNGAAGSPKKVAITQEAPAAPAAHLTITDGVVTQFDDGDGDGFASFVQISINIEKNPQTGNGVAAFTRIYAQNPVTAEWIYGGEAPVTVPVLSPHTVAWNWSVFEEDPRGSWNFRVELYRTGQTVPDATRSNSNDSSFAGVKLEPTSEDLLATTNSIRLDNNSNQACTVLNISPVTSDTWGANFLPSNIPPGGSRVVTGIANNNYDLRVIFANNQTITVWDQVVTGGLTYIWHLSLTAGAGPNVIRIINEGGYSVDNVYISPVSSPYWGEDVLGNWIIAGGTYQDFTGFRDDGYDMLAEFSNGDERILAGVLLQGGQRFDWRVSGGFPPAPPQPPPPPPPPPSDPPCTGCGPCFKFLAVTQDGSLTENRLPADTAHPVTLGNSVAIRVACEESIDPNTLRVKSTLVLPFTSEWLPGNLNGTDGWMLVTFSGMVKKTSNAIVAVYGSSIDGNAITPRVETFSIVNEQGQALTESEATIEPDVPPPFGSSGSASVYRLMPELPYPEPRSFKFPVPAGTKTEDIAVHYYSESGDAPSWYPGEHVVGWLAADGLSVVEVGGQTFVEIRVHHGGVVHIDYATLAAATMIPSNTLDDGIGILAIDVVAAWLIALMASYRHRHIRRYKL